MIANVTLSLPVILKIFGMSWFTFYFLNRPRLSKIKHIRKVYTVKLVPIVTIRIGNKHHKKVNVGTVFTIYYDLRIPLLPSGQYRQKKQSEGVCFC